MRDFKGILIRISVLLLFILGLNGVGEFLYKSVSDATYIALDDMEEITGEVETILIGTSTIQRGINPEIVRDSLNTVCFNMGSASQPITGTYYILKEQLKKNPVERVFMTVGVKSFMSDTDNRSTLAKLRVFDMLQSPLAKLEFLFKIAEPKEYEQFFLFPARVEEKLNLKRIKRNIEYRYTEDYKKGIVYPKSSLKYYGLGMLSNEREYDNGREDTGIPLASTWDNSRLHEENINAIREIINLCKENNVEFNMVVLPMVEEYAKKQKNLHEMDQYVQEFCEEQGVNLFNYNYTARKGIYDYVDNSCYMDRIHLNIYGATRMADLLCQDYLSKKGQM